MTLLARALEAMNVELHEKLKRVSALAWQAERNGSDHEAIKDGES